MALKDCHCACVQDLLRRVEALEKYVPHDPRQRIEELPMPVAIAIALPKSAVAIENQIEDVAINILGRCEPKKEFAKKIKELRSQHGIEPVIDAFTSWAECQVRPYQYAKPVASFLRSYRWDAPTVQVGSPNLEKVVNEIAYISENVVIFTPTQKMVVATMINEFGPEAVVRGFKDFYAKTDTDQRPWAAKNFVEKGGTFLRVQQRQKKDVAEMNLALEEATRKGKAEFEEAVAKREAEILEESEIEEEL